MNLTIGLLAMLIAVAFGGNDKCTIKEMKELCVHTRSAVKDWNEENRSGDDINLDNVKEWAEAVNDIFNPIRLALGTVDKAIATATKARTFIKEMKTDMAVIINVSKKSGTWSTYNDVSPIKICTQFKSYMAAYTTVQVHTLGCGAMHVYLDNKDPPHLVDRNGVYLYDGEGLTLVGRSIGGDFKVIKENQPKRHHHTHGHHH